VAEAQAAGKTICLVPTMGALHAGHASLIDAARKGVSCGPAALGWEGKQQDTTRNGKTQPGAAVPQEATRKLQDTAEGGCATNGFVVVSVFVNPTQFGPNEDLAKYPRTPEKDLELCRKHGADLVFMPSAEEMYGGGSPLTEITVKALSGQLCGRSRPVHFAGVCTVVAKLFNIVQPDRAFFGAKDFQQATIIRRMTADLNFPVEIVVCPTVREADGVAMSSRNAYLSDDHRRQAPALHQSLELGCDLILREHPPAGAVVAAMREHLARSAPDGVVDYLEIVDPQTLCGVEMTDNPVVIAMAVKLGATRLIDNIAVDAAGAAQ
jgi:pantoate--beta-alanine ligase